MHPIRVSVIGSYIVSNRLIGFNEFSTMTPPARPLRILHVLRSPVGGLFRHVVDVARGQAARGHMVGMICDASTGGAHATQTLNALSPDLRLGLSRFAMARQISVQDVAAIRQVARFVAQSAPDVVHGHGAKGGAFARLAVGAHGPLRVYTPHGGSLLFEPGTVSGFVYLSFEKLLNPRTDLLLFESAFIARLYRTKVGEPAALPRIVPNGVGAAEFEPVPLREDATDILYIGELRHLKGVDVLLAAMAALRARGLSLTATIVGAGASSDELKRQAEQSGLTAAVRFLAPMPARQAFALGRIMVVPSRLESFPYIVLEAAAAGKPLIATSVGGIPDMFGPFVGRLIQPDDHNALADKLSEAVNQPETITDAASLLRERIRTNFSLDDMVEGGIDAYSAALAALQKLKSK
jgi:glycosyltransferase involved in cell wall biosynthesis